jgi:hypothetical protein
LASNVQDLGQLFHHGDNAFLGRVLRAESHPTVAKDILETLLLLSERDLTYLRYTILINDGTGEQEADIDIVIFNALLSEIKL